MKIRFAPNNKIDNSSHKLIAQIYGIKGAFLTDESSLYDSEESLDEIPGHKLTRFTDIPLTDRKSYKKEPDCVKLDRFWVWYPQLSETENQELNEAYKRVLTAKLEGIYGISFKDYPKVIFFPLRFF